MADQPQRRRYSNAEAQAILRKALGEEIEEGLGHDELVAAACEVGLSREQVERAIAAVEVARSEEEARRGILARRRSRFTSHLVPFVAVNGFLLAINLLTSPSFWWFLFPLLGWGLGLFFHAWAALSSVVTDRQLQREFARAERSARRAAKQGRSQEYAQRQKERRLRLEQSAHAFGEVMEEGAAAILTRLAKELRENSRAASGNSDAAPEARRQRVIDLEDAAPSDSAAEELHRRRR